MVITKDRIVMLCPDNWHTHYREGALRTFMVATLIISGFIRRVLGMPNLKKPILTGRQAKKYGTEIVRIARKKKGGKKFKPVIAIQITKDTTPEMIFEAWRMGIRAGKVYPRYVTTNSEHGVIDYFQLWPVFAAMQKCGMILLLHGESPDESVEGLHKERVFLKTLKAIVKAFPRLKIVLEHISTRAAMLCVLSMSRYVSATITIHHLLYTLDDVIGYSKASGGKGQGDFICKPSLKFRRDRAALRWAAMSGNPKFFYGGDDAPHYGSAKHTRKISCGVFNTMEAIASLIELFEEYGKLKMLEGFLSIFGARFYGFPPNRGTVTFVRESWTVPEKTKVPRSKGEYLTSMRAGETIPWKYQPSKRAA